jgi:competence protein ComEA
MLAGVGVGLSAQALDLNTATAEQLTDLRGLGPRTAQIIVQERNRAGPFESLEDLSDRVRGIGLKRLQALQAAGLRVPGAGTASGSLSAKGQSAASQVVPRRVALPTGVATPTIEPMPSQ